MNNEATLDIYAPNIVIKRKTDIVIFDHFEPWVSMTNQDLLFKKTTLASSLMPKIDKNHIFLSQYCVQNYLGSIS